MLFGKKRIIFLNISVNTIKAKDEKNKTKDEEPSITDNSVINACSHFKLFKCGKISWTNLITHVNERAWKLQRKSMIQNWLRINDCTWKSWKKIILWNFVTINFHLHKIINNLWLHDLWMMHNTVIKRLLYIFINFGIPFSLFFQWPWFI